MQATSTVSLCYIHGLGLGEVKISLAAQAASWQPSQLHWIILAWEHHNPKLESAYRILGISAML